MDEMMQELAKRDETFQQVQPKGLEDLPDGSYIGRVEEMRLDRARSGRLQIKTTLKVSGSDYDGRSQWHYRGLDKPEDMEHLKGDLERWGWGELESLLALPAVFEDMTGRYLNFLLKTGRDGQQRLYLGKILEAE